MKLSKEKYQELVNELDYLTTTRRAEIAEELEYAKSLGDLSENAEYHEARDNQAKSEQRIAELQTILKDVEVLKPKKGGVADVGSTVTVKKKGTQKERAFMLVESEEADTAAGKISVVSPLGKCLVGRKEGDKATCETPAGEVEYTIVKIG
jgi:transcription elongation factor GreA